MVPRYPELLVYRILRTLNFKGTKKLAFGCVVTVLDYRMLPQKVLYACAKAHVVRGEEEKDTVSDVSFVVEGSCVQSWSMQECILCDVRSCIGT